MTAVQGAENTGANTDLLTVIRDAVAKALQDAGIDPATAADNEKVDASTKKLLAALDSQAKIEAQTTNILASLDSQTNADSTSADFLSQLQNLNGNGPSCQNLLGYLLDTQQ